MDLLLVPANVVVRDVGLLLDSHHRHRRVNLKNEKKEKKNMGNGREQKVRGAGGGVCNVGEKREGVSI